MCINIKEVPAIGFEIIFKCCGLENKLHSSFAAIGKT